LAIHNFVEVVRILNVGGLQTWNLSISSNAAPNAHAPQARSTAIGNCAIDKLVGDARLSLF